MYNDDYDLVIGYSTPKQACKFLSDNMAKSMNTLMSLSAFFFIVHKSKDGVAFSWRQHKDNVFKEIATQNREQTQNIEKFAKSHNNSVDSIYHFRQRDMEKTHTHNR